MSLPAEAAHTDVEKAWVQVRSAPRTMKTGDLQAAEVLKEQAALAAAHFSCCWQYSFCPSCWAAVQAAVSEVLAIYSAAVQEETPEAQAAAEILAAQEIYSAHSWAVWIPVLHLPDLISAWAIQVQAAILQAVMLQ